MAVEKNESNWFVGGDPCFKPRNKRERLITAAAFRHGHTAGYNDGVTWWSQGRSVGCSEGRKEALDEMATEIKCLRDAVAAFNAKLTGARAMIRAANDLMKAAGIDE